MRLFHSSSMLCYEYTRKQSEMNGSVEWLNIAAGFLSLDSLLEQYGTGLSPCLTESAKYFQAFRQLGNKLRLEPLHKYQGL